VLTLADSNDASTTTGVTLSNSDTPCQTTMVCLDMLNPLQSLCAAEMARAGRGYARGVFIAAADSSAHRAGHACRFIAAGQMPCQHLLPRISESVLTLPRLTIAPWAASTAASPR